MEEKANFKKGKRKFKQTKQLVKLAINEGWSQSEVANACRTQQSVVSAWAKGTTQGTEQQLMPLLEKFGYKLRRNSFRVYWSLDSEEQKKTFHKIEGKIVLSHTFNRIESYNSKVKKVPEYRLIAHHQGANMFRLVFQSRLIFKGSSIVLQSTVDDAVWRSTISAQYDLLELLDVIDGHANEMEADKYPNDGYTLPFIARQALLNHGFDIAGVVEYPAVW